MKYEPQLKESAVSVFCGVIGGLSALAGVLVFAIAIFSLSTPGAPSAAFIGLGAMLSSVLWFAIGKAITLLNEIAHNTRK